MILQVGFMGFWFNGSRMSGLDTGVQGLGVSRPSGLGLKGLGLRNDSPKSQTRTLHQTLNF